ncbi:lipoyl synthase [Desulfonatronum thiodismutans]|uniref:lipoyl synthase n=1 Tax=Desulfonatronum thiodismutans TaxID=159290 RepID=UPI00068CC315|nr:lipoyl synthase [Desulfonatronum thiodismutans]
MHTTPSSTVATSSALRKPPWLRRPLPRDGRFFQLSENLRGLGLATVCRSARCPNIGECFSSGTATFLILGDVCTRSCAFCNITSGRPGPVAGDEPFRVSQAVAAMGLRYAVITSVTRDDLPDGGAEHFARVVRQLKTNIPGLAVEVLIPDFQGSRDALETVLESGVDVLNHNLETVPDLYPRVRPQAGYARSLELLARARDWAKEREQNVHTKSGLMLGLGETREQLRRVFRDLAASGCAILTMGQYLAPSAAHHPVIRYPSPEEFAELATLARAEGIGTVFSAPLVRSSYHASEVAESALVASDSTSTLNTAP